MADIHPADRVSTAQGEPPPSLASLYLSPKPTDGDPITCASFPEVLRECPLPLSELERHPLDIPKHLMPSIINVNTLAPKEKARAYASASRKYVELKIPDIREKYQSIVAFNQREKPLRTALMSRRTASMPMPKGPGLLSVQKTAEPQEKRVPGRSPARLIVSAPPAARNVLDRRVPGSPMGNAWSGEHYWAPQFSPQLVTPRSKNKSRELEGLLALQSPESQAAYYAVREAAKIIVDSITTEAEARGYPISICNMPETEVLAAKNVLDNENLEFSREAQCLPVPSTISSRMFALAIEESKAISSWGIDTATDLSDVSVWMRVDESTLQVSTVLDSAKEALAMIKERRKGKDLDISEAAWGLVHAVCLLGEKQKKLERGGKEEQEECEESDEEGYGFFLKSIKEEIRDSVERRKKRESEKSGARDSVKGGMRVLEVDETRGSQDYTKRASHTSTQQASEASTHRVSNGSVYSPSNTSTHRASNASNNLAFLAANNRHSAQTQDTPATSEPTGHLNVSLGTTYDQLADRIASGEEPTGSLGRASTFNIESRKSRGKAPNVLDLANWAEELRNLKEATGEKVEDMDDEHDDGEREEDIGVAITRD